MDCQLERTPDLIPAAYDVAASSLGGSPPPSSASQVKPDPQRDRATKRVWSGMVVYGRATSRPVGTWWDVAVASSRYVVGHCCHAALSGGKGTHRLTKKSTGMLNF